jgi:PhoH-like ATPase
MAKKTFILDTNVLLDDSKALNSFQDNNIILPLIVIEELDRHKDRNDPVGMNARETSRLLNRYIKEGGDLRKGVKNDVGGTLKVVSLSDFEQVALPNYGEDLGDYHGGDNKIIQLCLMINHNRSLDERAILVSRDVLLRVKCHVLGIPCEDRKKDSIIKSSNTLYQGYRYIEVDDDVIQKYYESIPENFFPFNLSSFVKENEEPLLANEFVIFKDKNGKCVNTPLRHLEGERTPHIVQLPKLWKIKPKNLEQIMALDLLLDPNVKLVTLTGPSGTGKTLISIAAGLHQIIEARTYKSMLVSKPVQAVGKDIGFLPGDKNEKMEPWLAPLKDNLRFLLSNDKDNGSKSKKNDMTLDHYFSEGIIEMEAITFMRGRSIANAFMFFDEIQNISAHELKTIITRVGENTKIVLTGDIEQIDTLSLDATNNGLSISVEKFKKAGLAGHIALCKGERSALATLAASIL